MVSAPARREQALYTIGRGLSQRRACALLGVARSTLRYESRRAALDGETRTKLRALATEHPRWGYRLVRALLARRGETMNAKRAFRLWRLEGLSRPRRRPRHRFHRVKPAELHRGAPNVVWAMDFVLDRCAAGRRFRCLTVVDEGTRECLGILVRRSIRAEHVTKFLHELVARYGCPTSLRTDNGSEFTSLVVTLWRELRGVRAIFNEPGKPWQNGVNESFNGRFREECLSPEWYANEREAAVLIEAWRRRYNEERPHSALGYCTPSEARSKYLLSTDERRMEAGALTH